MRHHSQAVHYITVQSSDKPNGYKHSYMVDSLMMMPHASKHVGVANQ